MLAAAYGKLDRAAGPLFQRNGSVWTPLCSKAGYEKQRKALNGTHIMPNALRGVRAFDVQQFVSICMYMLVYLSYRYVYRCICMYMHVYVYVYVFISMYNLVNVCICMYMPIYMFI